MRARSGALRRPLDHVLAAPSHLAVLRALLDATEGMSGRQVARVAAAGQRYAFFDWFDAIVISGDVGLAKPDPGIFSEFLTRVGRTAEECLFIDDAEANVAVASRLGFQTIRFESSEQLATELCGRGLLKQDDSVGLSGKSVGEALSLSAAHSAEPADCRFPGPGGPSMHACDE